MVIKGLGEIQRKFYERGLIDESFVMKAVEESLGGECWKSSSKEDKEDHIDFWWNSPRKGIIGVDVKGMKKVSRSDKEASEDAGWLELEAGNHKPGWLRGKAEYIAFRELTKTIFVKREKALELAERVSNGKDVLTYNPRKPYIPYTRYGKNDLIVMVTKDDLESIADFCIDYEKGC